MRMYPHQALSWCHPHQASAIVAMPPMEFGTDFADYQQAMEKTMQIYEALLI